jgi:hypothetical protein
LKAKVYDVGTGFEETFDRLTVDHADDPGVSNQLIFGVMFV